MLRLGGALDAVRPAGSGAGAMATVSAARALCRSQQLGKALHPRTAANLAGLVRVMNTYYSNLIEGDTVAVKVIDIFGNDAMTLVPVNVG